MTEIIKQSNGVESREWPADDGGNPKTTLATQLSPDNDGVQSYPDDYLPFYQAAAAANVVIKAEAGYLKGILVGADVASSTIEVSDSATDGDGNVKVFLSGSTLQGYYPVEAYFANGITADIVNQTLVTFIYR
jgi:hypothetical protein